jgi:hypothetical protein
MPASGSPPIVAAGPGHAELIFKTIDMDQCAQPKDEE